MDRQGAASSPTSSRPSYPGLRRAEVVAALSLATDLGSGHPVERALRACLLAVHFGDAIGLGADDLTEAYYLALLRYAGCTADAHRAQLFGDEIALGVQIDAVELWRPIPMLRFLFQHAGEGQPPLRRARMLASGLATGVQRSEAAAIAHCEVSQHIAGRLGLGPAIQYSLGQMFERWDGHGVPGQAQGERLTQAARVAHLAIDAELFYRLGGAQAAIAVARERSGGQYDPGLVERFCHEAPRLLKLLDADSVWTAALDAEPGQPVRLAEAQFDEALHTIADFADLRSAYTRGHSPAVAELAAAAARRCGLPEADVAAARRAGLLHDVGMSGVSISICDKPGPLGESDWERLRLHPYYTERILARPRGLAQLGALAALHHERLDGSGYHRSLPAPLLPPAARILAAADVYQAMIEARAHRPARAPEAAADELRREARAGRLDGDAVRTVLDAAGHRIPRVRAGQVAGLSERELEVLRLLARGHSNRQMARQLTISERTVDHHIRHIYAKIGVSTRAAATMFAMQHHLVGDVEGDTMAR
jgi:HD-GYP domain-containing protein (c-di-GMP phosphodiesterase class II)